MAEWLWRVAQDDIYIFFGWSNLSELSHRVTCRGSNPLLLKDLFLLLYFFIFKESSITPFTKVASFLLSVLPLGIFFFTRLYINRAPWPTEI